MSYSSSSSNSFREGQWKLITLEGKVIPKTGLHTLHLPITHALSPQLLQQAADTPTKHNLLFPSPHIIQADIVRALKKGGPSPGNRLRGEFFKGDEGA
jgi:hypothetical protein